jgi:hypothetical protein
VGLFRTAAKVGVASSIHGRVLTDAEFEVQKARILHT